MTSTPPAVLLDVDAGSGVARLTLNRAERRNALSTELVDTLAEAVSAALADTSVRVLVLTGAGPVFCAGADLTERRTVTTVGGDDVPTFVRVFEMLLDAPKPVVAQLNGPALAGGLGLVCACDFAVAPESAQFGFTEVRIGVAPAIISVVCLPKLRRADAARLFLTGERIGAAEAVRVGLITHVAPDGEVEQVTRGLVDQLTLGAPAALAASKALLRDVPAYASRRDAFRATSALSAGLFAGADGQEGMGAFKEKRLPSWVPADHPARTGATGGGSLRG